MLVDGHREEINADGRKQVGKYPGDSGDVRLDGRVHLEAVLLTQDPNRIQTPLQLFDGE